MINWGLHHEIFSPTARLDAKAWINPCTGVLAPPGDEDAPESNRPWSDEERVAVFTEAPLELAIVFGLCLYAQLNIAHAIDIPPSAIKIERRSDGTIGRRLKWKRAKNAERIDVEIAGPLALIVDACNKTGPTLALSSRGDPWTYAGVDTARKRLLGRLVEEGKVEAGLTFHGLRSTLGAIAAEGGASDKQIAAAIHDSTSEMGAHYSRSAEKRRLAEAARKPLIERDKTLILGILASRLENRLENPHKVAPTGSQKS